MENKIDMMGKSISVIMQHLPRWIINGAENYHTIKGAFKSGKASTVSELAVKHKGRPAIIVAAGPSLEYTMPHMKEIIKKHNPVIFCSNSSINGLLAEGIRPDYNVIYDALDVIKGKYWDLMNEEVKGIPLLTHPEIDPTTLRLWLRKLGKVYFFLRGVPDEGDLYSNYLMQIMPIIYSKNPFLKKQIFEGIYNVGCVGNLEVILAGQFGCNPIYLAGMNFGYPGLVSHYDPRKKVDGEWIKVGYAEDINLEERIKEDKENKERKNDFYISDNGIYTTDIDVMYKMALMGIWVKSIQQIFEIVADGHYGILDLFPKIEAKDFAAGKVGFPVSQKEKHDIVQKYHDDHGYTAEDFKQKRPELGFKRPSKKAVDIKYKVDSEGKKIPIQWKEPVPAEEIDPLDHTPSANL